MDHMIKTLGMDLEPEEEAIKCDGEAYVKQHRCLLWDPSLPQSIQINIHTTKREMKGPF